MQTGPEAVRQFMTAHKVEPSELHEWLSDAGFPEEEMNHHDTRFLRHVETFIAERDQVEN